MKLILIVNRHGRTAHKELNEAVTLLHEFGIESQAGTRRFSSYSRIFVEDSEARPALAHLLGAQFDAHI